VYWRPANPKTACKNRVFGSGMGSGKKNQGQHHAHEFGGITRATRKKPVLCLQGRSPVNPCIRYTHEENVDMMNAFLWGSGKAKVQQE